MQIFIIKYITLKLEIWFVFIPQNEPFLVPKTVPKTHVNKHEKTRRKTEYNSLFVFITI